MNLVIGANSSKIGEVRCGAWNEHRRECSSICRSYAGDLGVDEVVVVFCREVGFGGGLVFAEKVVDHSPYASSFAAGCADFLPPVCGCLGLRQFTAAFQCVMPSCSGFGLPVGLEFPFQPSSCCDRRAHTHTQSNAS